MKGHVLCRHHAGLDPLPGTFSGLMDLYERNYMLVRRLVPNVAVSGCEYISRVPGNMDLYMRVGERFRFTTELQFTYRFERDEGWVSEPDVLVRIYHDARLAEVMMAHLRRSPAFTAHEFAAGGHIRQRWHVNRFLFKWLGYCVRQGHGFEHLAEREERIG